ncbi:MAG: 16S rRNA (adenine(1518)-N(6)/adenine(1519)-N(6))-dimethyltransferase RsmA [Alphaproteobacteria bacterium]|uniref:Ribosomal RNA small subunit methyltransferase A n=1 Tax=Candidatus Nitrobium versatile TaxID=2884831 RepID=A0A953JBU9_9BACT|nr:16S rRNA (adenine(1518)-N(6)/adenine(1519)-N(6))-dimethyltransferase RsmA [Candidatus Nitrobium versatile]
MAKKHLGQNFLFDPSILHRIIEVSGITPEDTVVEIGPGPGRLTLLLAGAARKVVAVELDKELYEKLKGEIRGYRNIELIHADALHYPYQELEPFKVVANIPYYITTPLIFRLIEAREKLQSMTLTIQKEVAERIVAGPGTKEYGVLSVMLQYYSEARISFIIPRGAFRPTPEVDSAVIHFEIRKSPKVSVRDERLFFTTVKTAFAQRRKTLANALKSLAKESREGLLLAGIDPTRRAETLSIEEFAVLADTLRSLLPSRSSGRGKE